MIYPKYHSIYTPLWGYYFKSIINSNFHGFYPMANVKPQTERSILLLANHFSWWDGFFAYRLNQLLFKKRFHVMMLEENLAKNKFLRYSGAYSVARNSRSLLQTLQYTEELLKTPQNLVLIFPQGEIKSAFQQSHQFEKGAFRLANNNAEIQLIHLAMFIDYFEQKKPGVYLYTQELSQGAFSDFATFKSTYIDFQELMRAQHGEKMKSGI